MTQRALNVGVDARHLGGGRGVARYTSQLLSALAALHPDDRYVLFVPGRGPVPTPTGVELKRHRLPGRVLFGSAALTGRPRLDALLREPVDVIWVPAVVPVALSPSIPYVLTVHDLSFEARPADFTAYERLWHRLARPRALARNARLVIVPSAHVGAELQTGWGLAPERIRVVPEGVDHGAPEPRSSEPRRSAPRVAGRARPYLLAVGALEPRKAPLLLLRAFLRARGDGLGAELVFAGEGRLAGQLSGEAGVTVLGRVSDGELDRLYRDALALVSPSLLEGYGLPVREALARGTPAVVSDLPVYGPELSAAVVRVAPGDVQALTAALLELPAVRERLAAAAPGCVADLTWERAARLTREALAQAAA
jgi:glycosyltransferase involved in cell wall biosynthesis